MLVAIAADGSGSALGESICAELCHQGQVILDFGISDASLGNRYPDYAYRVAWSVNRGDADRGIICSARVGACCAAANLFEGVRAVIFDDCSRAVDEAVAFDTVNILCLAAHNISHNRARELVRSFIDARFDLRSG